MAQAAQSDVETSLVRALTGAEAEHVDALLDRAERLISVRIPGLAARVAEDPDFGLIVADVEAESVAQVLRAPDGFQQEGEGNYSYSLNLRVASGLLDILDAEWAKLGISRFRGVDPATDGYARARYGSPALDPAYLFQYGWGGGDQLSEDVTPWV